MLTTPSTASVTNRPCSANASMVGELSTRLGDELILATEWSLLRVLAVPAISKTFAQSGRYFEQTESRQQAAMLVIHRLFQHGAATPENQQMLQWVHRIHQSYGVPDIYIQYTLGCLLLGIPAWFDRFSSTKIQDADRAILLDFVNSIASWCTQDDPHVRNFTVPQWHAFVCEFEAEHRGYCPDNLQMYDAMATLLSSRLPRLLNRWGRTVFIAATPSDLQEFIRFRDLSLVEKTLYQPIILCRRHIRFLKPLFAKLDRFLVAKDQDVQRPASCPSP